ncbi:MAG: DMT family transporter [Thaumarchaeota archaeon]|nr:DMT family transporter [Nitrososphaerota archaeon]
MASFRYLAPYILITAFTYVFAKDALSYASPFVYGALTTLVCCVVLFIITRGKLVLNRDTILFAVFYWLSGACLLLGLNFISAAQSAILSFTMPLMAIPLSVYVLGEKASRIEAYGAVVGFVGVVVYNIPLLGGTVTLIGVGLVLGDAFFWALFSVYMRKLRLQDPIQTLATGSLVSFLFYGALSFADFSFRPSLNLLFDVGFLGVVAWALNPFLWMALLRTEKLAKLTTLIFIAPVVTLVYGAATTGVIPSYITLGGVALIFIGIYTSSILGGRSADAVSPPATAVPGSEHNS